MKNIWGKCILILLIIINIFILGGCDNKKVISEKAPKTTAQKYDDAFEGFIKNYYNSEISSDENYLKQFFINPNVADIQLVKKKFLIFNIEKVKFQGVYNIKKSGRIAVMVSTFDALFKSINNPRPDVEILVLINKNKSWYFLNDDDVLKPDEAEWVNEQRKIESKFIVTDKKMQNILQTNKKFDEDNRTYMEACQQKFLQQQSATK